MSLIDTEPELIIDRKADWKVIAAKATSALERAEETAEDLAARIKSLYKDEEAHIQAPRADYDAARHAYNAIAVQLRTLLILGKNAPAMAVSTESPQELLNKFEGSAQTVIDEKTKSRSPEATLAGFVPSLGDICKVFDSIMTAIEWFKTRNDKERHELADILESAEIRPWSEAGMPRPEKKQPATDTSSKKAKTEGAGD